MLGTITQVNISPGGVPKRSILEGILTPLGVRGDSCANPKIHGGPNQAVLLIASETIDELVAAGYPVFAGALGENLTTRGLDRRLWRIGQQFRVGDALVELSKVRAPCITLDVYGPSIKNAIYDKQVKAGDVSSPRWGMSGMYARVLKPGFVSAGAPIELVGETV